ncbi:hypothetical protein DYB30_010531 [Aphanomyces astaci]|uniref:ODAD1 central coiled coil region domain-containing protein n=1 Tax=Aphanomyces astaci TaxID=112090 RepID=A0A397C3U4_APHAT|nr:hypothetical protein DYB30_010531 [Aphanomyces astaci]
MDRMIPLTASVEVLSLLANSVGVEDDEVDNDLVDNDVLEDGGLPLRLHADVARGSDSDVEDGETEKKRYTVQEQRDVIRKIHESNQILKQELSIEWREAKAMLGAEKQAKLKRLQKQSTSYSHKIEQEKRVIKKLEESVAARHRELQHLREENVRNDKLESAAAATRRVRALENRLEISLVKKNEVESINKHLRQQIDKVRRDRIVFDGIYKKLERETYEYRHRLEVATAELAKGIAAKEHMDKEVQDLQLLVESEQVTYERDFKELRILIATSKREATDQARAIELAPETEVVSGQLSSDQESTIHRSSALSSWKIAYDKALSTASNAEALRYQQMFDTIYAETGIPDADKLAQEIQRKDEDNFKKFKHVEGLHKETDDLRVEIEKTTAELEAYKLQEGIGTNVLDKATFRALSAKLAAVEDANKRLDAEFDETGVRLARVKATVHSLFTMLNQKSSEKGQGGAAVHSVSLNDITDANMLEYLQVVETCIISLLLHNNDGSGGATHGPHVLAETSPYANAKKFKQALEPPSCHDLTGSSMALATSRTYGAAGRTSARAGTPTTHRPHNVVVRGGGGSDEDERALTYDELKESAQAAFATATGHKTNHRATAHVVMMSTPPPPTS